jgi:hypothetical protein
VGIHPDISLPFETLNARVGEEVNEFHSYARRTMVQPRPRRRDQ